ncbi:organic cation transporter protein-like [Argopecten irradians]|uniref:organic cation transporter protein-like n=1 Tax=Argopecten irradians TaxID=31199 RepID=UPI00372229D2
MDNVLVNIGEFGIYQKFVYFLICLSCMFCGFYEMMSVITLYTPGHRCKIPGLENDTYRIQSIYHQNLIDNVIPPSDINSHSYDQCHLYSTNELRSDNSSGSVNVSRIPCTEWVYSDDVFVQTITTKFNIVCSDAYLIPLVKSLYIVGKLIGAVVFGNLSDSIGRRTTFCIALMLMFGVTFGMSWCSSYAMYTVLMMVLGASTQGIFPVGMVLSIELVGPSKRKYTGLVFEYFYSTGLVILPSITYFLRHWYYVNIICSAPMVLFVSYWWLIPESPRWLISKHRYQDAYNILKKIAKANKMPIDEAIMRKEQTTTSTPGAASRLWHLFSTRSFIFRTLIVMLGWCITSMTYYGLSLNAGNLAGDFYLNMIISGLIEMPAHTIALLIVDRVGRKRVYCMGMILGGCACASTIIPIIINEIDNVVIVTTLAMIGKFCITTAYDTMFFYTTELFPTVLRNAALGLCSCAARTGGMVAPFIADSAVLVNGITAQVLPFGVFGFLSVIAGLSSIYLPETSYKSLPETMEDCKLLGRSSDELVEETETNENTYKMYGSNGQNPRNENKTEN